MKLRSLLKVIDGDTKIIIQRRLKDLYVGRRCELELIKGILPFESEVLAIWYSTRDNSIIIEV